MHIQMSNSTPQLNINTVIQRQSVYRVQEQKHYSSFCSHYFQINRTVYVMNLWKLSQILVRCKLHPLITFLLLNTSCSSSTVTLNEIQLQHNIRTIKALFHHHQRTSAPPILYWSLRTLNYINFSICGPVYPYVTQYERTV